MKSFMIRRLRIASRREKTAIDLAFRTAVTVIRGENDTGKSSLMKTVYWTLGCEPAKTSETWAELDICAALTVDICGEIRTFVRHGRHIGVFDAELKVVETFSKIGGDFSALLARMLAFGLTLPNRETGHPEIPPPAFYLLPYCMDQDLSWGATWAAFKGLGQYTRWTQDVAEYHVGLRDGRYYVLKGELRTIAAERIDPEREERALDNAITRVAEELGPNQVNLDPDAFESETKVLLERAEQLASEQAKYRQKVEDLASRRAFLGDHLKLAIAMLSEIDGDYRMALEHDDPVACPTCGEEYRNAIAQRFSIAVDSTHLEDIIADARAEIGEIDTALAALSEKLCLCRTRSADVSETLATRHGDITLRTVIRSAARGEAVGVLQRQLDNTRKRLSELAERERQADLLLRDISSKERRRSLLDDLGGVMEQYSVALSVAAPSKIQRFAFPIKETGSDAPRAILAYQFAILNLAWRRPDVIHAPLCIDSPNQQDQDPGNYKLMLTFIRDNLPVGQQLILAVVDTAEVEFPGEEIVLDRNRSLLRADVYHKTGRELSELLARMHSTK